jgi:hypothetical protein
MLCRISEREIPFCAGSASGEISFRVDSGYKGNLHQVFLLLPDITEVTYN